MKLVASLTAAAVAAAVAGAALAADDSTQALPDVHPRGSTMLESVGIAIQDLKPAATTPGGATLYTAERNGVACVTDRRGTGHCAPISGLDEGLGFGGELCRPGLPADETRITAVLPSEVSSVALMGGDHVVADETVSAGIIGLELPRTVASKGLTAVLRTETGVRTVSVPAPPIDPGAPCDPDR